MHISFEKIVDSCRGMSRNNGLTHHHVAVLLNKKGKVINKVVQRGKGIPL